MIQPFVCAISFGSKIAENGFKNDIFVVKMQVPSLKWVYSFPTRSLSNYRLDCVFIILHVVIVTLRAKAYDVKILNDVITSRHYVTIVCERSLRQQ